MVTQAKTIPALKARTQLGQIMKRSFKNKERFIVEKSGIPMVAIINAGEYEEFVRMMERRDELFKVFDKNYNPDNISDAEVERDIQEAIKAVRKAKK